MAKSENILTVLKLKTLKPEQKGERLSDGGGLSGCVSVGRDGRVTVQFTYQFRIGERRREKRCGTWPIKDLADIRAEREKLRKQVNQGIDPIEQERRDKEEAERQQRNRELQHQLQAAEAARLAARMTFSELFEKWHAQQLQQTRKDKGAEIRRQFEKDVIPTLGNMFADEVTRRDIAALLNAIVARGSNRMANVTLTDLRQCFGWAIGGGLLENDPTSHLKKASFGGKEEERDRVLSDSELRHLLQVALPSSNLSVKGKAGIRIMLSTVARVGELLRAKREDIDLDRREWLIPKENAKNGNAHIIHLSTFACTAFTELLSVQDHPVWLFPDRTGTTHVCPKTLTKQIADRQRDSVPMTGRSKDATSLILSGGQWRSHDLRRTGSTLMGEIGIRPDVIDKCQNHIEENRVTRTYQRQELLAERKAAFNALGERLELLSNPTAVNVITLKRA
ncbi:site-specific integrase [Chitinibacter sp. GC72]|uniref:tyrosine-type recombinase/integrase n=1 Tax=Chitinibacter sp. GC72 TaxID=1526917 RepID=UPI0012FC3042|nr:site-specific integrase [Chitinibacter sp. GC72]